MICTRCGNNEPDGAAFCGRCGAPMSGRGAARGGRRRPDLSGAASNLGQMGSMATGGGLISWLLARPMISALALGGVAGGVVIAALALSGGNGGPKLPQVKSPPGFPGGANGSVLLTPQATQQIDEAPSPTPTVPAATPTPEPTATPQPSPTPIQVVATPIPPTPEPPPPPQPIATPTPEPPPPPPAPVVTLPPQKTSTRVAIAISGGQGSTHHVGESVQVCYNAVAAQGYRVYDTLDPTQVFAAGVGDGLQRCLSNATITPPLGADTVRIDALNSANAVIDFASVSIIVVP